MSFSLSIELVFSVSPLAVFSRPNLSFPKLDLLYGTIGKACVLFRTVDPLVTFVLVMLIILLAFLPPLMSFCLYEIDASRPGLPKFEA